MFHFFRQKMSKVNGLFQGHYADARVYYVFRFNEMPVINFIGELNGYKAFLFINECYHHKVADIYQHNYFDFEKNGIFFNSTLYVFRDKRMIELADNYCIVLHTSKQYNWGNELIHELAQFRMEAAAANDTKVVGFARNNNMN